MPTHYMTSPVAVAATRLLPAQTSSRCWSRCVPMLYGTRLDSTPGRLVRVCALTRDFFASLKYLQHPRGAGRGDSHLRRPRPSQPAAATPGSTSSFATPQQEPHGHALTRVTSTKPGRAAVVTPVNK